MFNANSAERISSPILFLPLSVFLGPRAAMKTGNRKDAIPLKGEVYDVFQHGFCGAGHAYVAAGHVCVDRRLAPGAAKLVSDVFPLVSGAAKLASDVFRLAPGAAKLVSDGFPLVSGAAKLVSDGFPLVSDGFRHASGAAKLASGVTRSVPERGKTQVALTPNQI